MNFSAFDRRSKAFYVGITNGGAIYRGTLGSDTVTPFIKGGPGKAAIGPTRSLRRSSWSACSRRGVPCAPAG